MYTTKFQQFSKDHAIDLQNVDPAKTEKLVQILQSNSLNIYDELCNLTNDETFEELALIALKAWSMDAISPKQTFTVLDFCEMKGAYHVEVEPLTKDNFPIILYDSQGWNNWPQRVESFFTLLAQKPHSESFLFTFEIPKHKLSENHFIFLMLLDQNKIIGFKEETESIKIKMLSASGRDALVKLLYPESYKKILRRPGVFTIHKIQEYLFEPNLPKRLGTIKVPGIEGPTSFHGLNVKGLAMLALLHDEFHRHSISSIPNEAYLLYLVAITTVRKNIHIGIQPLYLLLNSKELWRAADSEIGDYLLEQSQGSQEFTYTLAKLLNAKVFTEDKTIGLFPASPYVDTSWLLLIDTALHHQEPSKAKFHATFLYSYEYLTMYQFIFEHKDVLAPENSPAQNVAIIKSLYFNLDLPKAKDNIDLVKTSDRYLEVQVNGKPILLGKSKVMEVYDSLSTNVRSPISEEFINMHYSHPELAHYLLEPRILGLFKKELLTTEQLKTLNTPEYRFLKDFLMTSTRLYELLINKTFSIQEFLDLGHKYYLIFDAPIYPLISQNLLSLGELNTVSQNNELMTAITKRDDGIIYEALLKKEITIDELIATGADGLVELREKLATRKKQCTENNLYSALLSGSFFNFPETIGEIPEQDQTYKHAGGH